MWDFDEKWFMMGRGGKKNELVISRVRVKTPRRAQQGNREWISSLDRYCAQEVDDWTASQPLYSPLSKGDFIPMCERARQRAVTQQNIRSAWRECGIYPANWTKVMSNPKYSILFRSHPESPPPQYELRSKPQPHALTEVEKITAIPPTTFEESQAQLRAVSQIAQRNEAELAVIKVELHQALTREKPTQPSRVVLSKARFIQQGDLQNAHHAKEAPAPTTPRKWKFTGTQKQSAPKRRRPKQRKKWDNGVIAPDDSEVEREVENIEREEEEECTAEDDFSQATALPDQERLPLAESTGNVWRGV
jgi:hypothetical protein